MKNIEEFIVKVSEKDIDLLNKKIDLTRWPDEINHRWSHGTDLNFLKELANYWRNEFNWRDHEKKINDILNKGSEESKSNIKNCCSH